MKHSALNPKEEAKKLLYLRTCRWRLGGQALGQRFGSGKWIPGAQSMPSGPWGSHISGDTWELPLPGPKLYSIKTFAVPTSFLVTLNNHVSYKLEEDLNRHQGHLVPFHMTPSC